MNVAEYETLIAEHWARAARLRGEDAAQRAALYVWERHEALSVEEGVKTFFLRAKGAQLDGYRRSARRTSHECAAAKAEMQQPEDALEATPALLSALASLEEGDRDALLALVEHDSDHKAAAAACGLSVNNFRVALQRAKRKLARLLPAKN